MPDLSKRVMKPKMFFLQQRVASLCTKGNLLWMEQWVLRFRGYAISPGRWNSLRGEGGQWAFWCTLLWHLWSAIWKSMHLFKQRQMDSHTHTHIQPPPHTHTHTAWSRAKMWRRTVQFAHMCTSSPSQEFAYTFICDVKMHNHTHTVYTHNPQSSLYAYISLYYENDTTVSAWTYRTIFNSPRLYHDISFSFSRAASVQTFMSLIKAEPTQGGLRLFTADSSRQQYCSLQKLACTLIFPGKSSVAEEVIYFGFLVCLK